jgi:serine/threonine protein kinase/Tfp pilus assembly protein PilF
VDCPSCGQSGAPDRLECEHCGALLVDVFESDDSKTDPIQVIGGGGLSAEEQEFLRAAQQAGLSETESPPHETRNRLPTAVDYTGDLPRLFRFGERYQILEKLGEGGMGRVYKALDLELDRPVALKTIRVEKSGGREVLERFKQELVLARKITHRNVIRIYDLGEADGMKFFTMELIEGKSLRELLAERGKLSVSETLSFMKQMLQGLGEAHSQGVVHRDLKPQNVMVDDRGVLRIMDFGIARAADSATITGTSEMMGTPDYISPEQVRGEKADARSDLYSFGIILYELLTGETPFSGETAISKIVSRLQINPKSPRSLNSEIPLYLDRIILKCLEADPELRYASAEEVLTDLEREQVDRSFWPRLRKALSRRRGWVAAAVLVLAAVLAWTLMPEPQPVTVTTVAVLPFQNQNGAEDLEWMEEGLPDLLITDLSQSPALRPLMADSIHSVLQTLGKTEDARFDTETLRVISNRTGADYTITGRFLRANETLRVDVNLRRSTTGIDTILKVEAPSSEIFTLVDEILEKVSDELAPNAWRMRSSTEDVPLEAVRAYQEGLSALRGGAHQSAVVKFRQAIESDEDYAMAHAKLAEALFHIGDQAAAAKAIERAREIETEKQLPPLEKYQIHAIAARVEDDPQAAVETYRELAELYPESPDVVFNLASSLETAGENAEAAEAYRRVVTKSPDFGSAILGLGRTLVLSRKPDDAIGTLERALSSGYFQGDVESLGMIHSILGVADQHLGNYEAALVELERSLEYRRQAGDRRGIAASLTNLAKLQIQLGEQEVASSLLRESLDVARQADDPTMESFALVNLAIISRDLGKLEMALDYFRSSLTIEWERKEHTELADRLNDVGRTYISLGMYADAETYLEQAKVHLALSDMPDERAQNLLLLGRIHRLKGAYAEAVEALLGAVPLFLDGGFPAGAATARAELAAIDLAQGRLREALSASDRAVTESESAGDSEAMAHSLIQRAICLVRAGLPSEAAVSLERAATALGKGKVVEAELLRELVRGQLSNELGEHRQALRQLEKVREEARRFGLLALKLDASLVLGETLLEVGEPRRAIELFREVEEEASSRRLRPFMTRALVGNADAHWRLGDGATAFELVEKAGRLAESLEMRPLLMRALRLEARIARHTGDRDREDAAETKCQLLERWLGQHDARGEAPSAGQGKK